MVRAMCGVQLKDRERSTDLMVMLGLRVTIHQLAMANSICWYGHVLRRTLDFEVEGQDLMPFSKCDYHLSLTHDHTSEQKRRLRGCGGCRLWKKIQKLV